jgi:tRNA A-37 threonylcarbamoyl transferase component Bud32
MIDVRAALEQFRAHYGTARCGRLALDDQIVWVKQPEPRKGNRWNRLHAVVSRFFGDMMRSTAGSGGADALHAEAERLRQARSLGVPVPEVLHDGDDALMQSDCGEPLAARLRRQADAASREALLTAAIRALADLHRLGLCHGRPFIKDMTIRDGVIHLLDFEEDPLRVMPLARAQARDVWLFLQSASRYTDGDGFMLVRVLRAWNPPDADPVWAELARLARVLRPLRTLAQRLPARVGGSDLHAAVAANRALETALLS